MPGMPLLAAAAAAALVAGLAAVAARRVRDLTDEVRELGDRIGELSARLEATERNALSAVARADVAESVLLDKGVADEDDLEAARARSDATDPGYLPDRDGDLH
jgi:hypothetical protein